MQNLAEPAAEWTKLPHAVHPLWPVRLPISVIVPVRNEARNLAACLESLRGVGEVYVVDSGSTDETSQIARSFGVRLVQFHYHGGWPKKRQWALDTLPLNYDWVLLLDADEVVTPELRDEMQFALSEPTINGYYISLEMFFLGKRLRHSGARFQKLSLFRRGAGRFECRAIDQDASMCDMEVHEHVLVSGKCGKFKNPLIHRNVESLSRYIEKHNEYSNWEVRVSATGERGKHETLRPSIWGTQAQRRRWLRQKLFMFPGSPALFFLFKYVFRLGFLDGIPGLIYCGFQAIQFFHIKAKLYEAKIAAAEALSADRCGTARLEDRYVRH
jgi:glycosyltransferase involved in cell wall biosynthesis